MSPPALLEGEMCPAVHMLVSALMQGQAFRPAHAKADG